MQIGASGRWLSHHRSFITLQTYKSQLSLGFKRFGFYVRLYKNSDVYNGFDGPIAAAAWFKLVIHPILNLVFQPVQAEKCPQLLHNQSTDPAGRPTETIKASCNTMVFESIQKYLDILLF